MAAKKSDIERTETEKEKLVFLLGHIRSSQMDKSSNLGGRLYYCCLWWRCCDDGAGA